MPFITETYTSPGAQPAFQVPEDVTEVEVLVVAGGGSGGTNRAGGGGAGGVIYEEAYAVSPGSNISLFVGAGGEPPASGSGASQPSGNDGENSFFGFLTAIGGGGGGGSSNAGRPGGSGGGSGSDTTVRAGGEGVSGQGHDGGANGPGAAGERAAGGGGGAFEPGEDGTLSPVKAGDGGDGGTILGHDVGGGGGGSIFDDGTPGAGGFGGGGSGVAAGPGGDALPNTGGGGGGGGSSNHAEPNVGGAGGSGLIVVRFFTELPYPPPPPPPREIGFAFENALQIQFAGGDYPETSLGGVISDRQPFSGTLDNLFRRPTSAELASGITQYRCLFLHNVSGVFMAQFPFDIETKVRVLKAPEETDASIEIGLDPEPSGEPSVVIADEFMAPAGVTFAAHDTAGTALDIGTLNPGDYKAIWIKRVLAPGHPEVRYDRTTLAIQYEEEEVV